MKIKKEITFDWLKTGGIVAFFAILATSLSLLINLISFTPTPISLGVNEKSKEITFIEKNVMKSSITRQNEIIEDLIQKKPDYGTLAYQISFINPYQNEEKKQSNLSISMNQEILFELGSSSNKSLEHLIDYEESIKNINDNAIYMNITEFNHYNKDALNKVLSDMKNIHEEQSFLTPKNLTIFSPYLDTTFTYKVYGLVKSSSSSLFVSNEKDFMTKNFFSLFSSEDFTNRLVTNCLVSCPIFYKTNTIKPSLAFELETILMNYSKEYSNYIFALEHQEIIPMDSMALFYTDFSKKIEAVQGIKQIGMELNSFSYLNIIQNPILLNTEFFLDDFKSIQSRYQLIGEQKNESQKDFIISIKLARKLFPNEDIPSLVGRKVSLNSHVDLTLTGIINEEILPEMFFIDPKSNLLLDDLYYQGSLPDYLKVHKGKITVDSMENLNNVQNQLQSQFPTYTFTSTFPIKAVRQAIMDLQAEKNLYLLLLSFIAVVSFLLLFVFIKSFTLPKEKKFHQYLFFSTLIVSIITFIFNRRIFSYLESTILGFNQQYLLNIHLPLTFQIISFFLLISFVIILIFFNTFKDKKEIFKGITKKRL